MFNNPFHLFPSPLFSTAFAYLVLGAGAIDYILPRLVRRTCSTEPSLVRDRWSFWLIQVMTALAIIVGVVLRLLNWGLVSPGIQYVGLILVLVGLILREWAIWKDGKTI